MGRVDGVRVVQDPLEHGHYLVFFGAEAKVLVAQHVDGVLIWVTRAVILHHRQLLLLLLLNLDLLLLVRCLLSILLLLLF